MFRNEGFNDSRYDGWHLKQYIPSTRTSVYDTREIGTYPIQPRSFVSPNGILPPLSFHSASESGRHVWQLVFLNSIEYRTQPIYSEPLPNRYSQQPFFRNPEPPHPISRVPLFMLSEGTVGQILSYLTSADLAALALVDKDCRQLARTRQFRSVWINFSSASMALLGVLLAEAQERVGNRRGLSQNRWRLGACIRRMIVRFDSESKEEKPARISWVAEKVANNAANELHARHMNALDIVLRVALPNLECLDWVDSIPITPLIGSAIVAAHVTKLKLHGVTLREDFDISLGRGGVNWGLRSLVLSLRSAGGKDPTTYNFTASILKLAAPTLEELIWDGTCFSPGSRKHSFGEDAVLFPRLRKLQLKWVRADETVWSALIPANEKPTLAQLWVNYADSDLAPYLARRDHIGSLSHLTWATIRQGELPHLSKFIAANPQLQSFRHEDPLPEITSEGLLSNAPTDDIKHQLLPLLASSSLHALRSLALTWAGSTIPLAALRSVASIATLEHLWLTAGTFLHCKLNWQVDHKILRKRLRPLRQLQWLILTQDGYAHGNEYLIGYGQPPEGSQHVDEMVRYARLFAMSHPRLEWVHFGQIPMAVERGVEVKVVPLSEQKDVEGFLCHMWGDYHAT